MRTSLCCGGQLVTVTPFKGSRGLCSVLDAQQTSLLRQSSFRTTSLPSAPRTYCVIIGRLSTQHFERHPREGFSFQKKSDVPKSGWHHTGRLIFFGHLNPKNAPRPPPTINAVLLQGRCDRSSRAKQRRWKWLVAKLITIYLRSNRAQPKSES